MVAVVVHVDLAGGFAQVPGVGLHARPRPRLTGHRGHLADGGALLPHVGRVGF